MRPLCGLWSLCGLCTVCACCLCGLCYLAVSAASDCAAWLLERDSYRGSSRGSSSGFVRESVGDPQGDPFGWPHGAERGRERERQTDRQTDGTDGQIDRHPRPCPKHPSKLFSSRLGAKVIGGSDPPSGSAVTADQQPLPSELHPWPNRAPVLLPPRFTSGLIYLTSVDVYRQVHTSIYIYIYIYI
jgi:hypothetical protein